MIVFGSCLIIEISLGLFSISDLGYDAGKLWPWFINN